MKRFVASSVLVCFASISCKKIDSVSKVQNQSTQASTSEKWGVWFKCKSTERTKIASENMREFISKSMKWTIAESGTGDAQVLTTFSEDGQSVGFFLSNQNKNTLELAKKRPDLNIKNASLTYYRREFDSKKGPKGQLVKSSTPSSIEMTSTKEIVAALLSAGRITEFSGDACSFEQFIDHVAIRMNIVIWTMKAHLYFPDDDYREQYDKSKWHYSQNDEFTINPGVDIDEAIRDPLEGNVRYTMGCLKSCRFLLISGIADYYSKVKNSNAIQRLIEESKRRIFDSKVEGSLMQDQPGIDPSNWVPGDWGYIKNPDEYTAQYVDGDEGCNVIYVGNGSFGRYYENKPPRPFRQAICRVFNWQWTDKEYADDYVKKMKEKDPNFEPKVKPTSLSRDADFCFPNDQDPNKDSGDDRLNRLIQEMLSQVRTFPSTSLPSDTRASESFKCQNAPDQLCKSSSVTDPSITQ